MWQGALRHPDDHGRAPRSPRRDRQPASPSPSSCCTSDQIGGQRTISRFGLTVQTGDSRLASLNRHWYLDWDGPRPESLALAANEAVLRDNAALEERRAATGGQGAQQIGEGSSADSDRA